MVFQAEHQHLYDISPMVWFIHVREVGDPLRLARDVHAVISATSTPLLQEPPAHPTTPLRQSASVRSSAARPPSEQAAW